MYRLLVFALIFLLALPGADAQTVKLQQGLLLKSGSNIRLGDVGIFNTRSLAKSKSNTIGVFNIAALPGDTIAFTGNNFQINNLIVTNFADQIIYLEPVIQLNEVVIKENSLKNEIKEVQRGYRSKSVFYTGTPHYYYLVLKPMTFIYENFKSEVKEARRFNKFAAKETASYKVAERFNDKTIKRVVPIAANELKDFELIYFPSVTQINSWNDYDLINYIESCYTDFKRSKAVNVINLIETACKN